MTCRRATTNSAEAVPTVASRCRPSRSARPAASCRWARTRRGPHRDEHPGDGGSGRSVPAVPQVGQVRRDVGGRESLVRLVQRRRDLRPRDEQRYEQHDCCCGRAAEHECGSEARAPHRRLDESVADAADGLDEDPVGDCLELAPHVPDVLVDDRSLRCTACPTPPRAAPPVDGLAAAVQQCAQHRGLPTAERLDVGRPPRTPRAGVQPQRAERWILGGSACCVAAALGCGRRTPRRRTASRGSRLRPCRGRGPGRPRRPARSAAGSASRRRARGGTGRSRTRRCPAALRPSRSRRTGSTSRRGCPRRRSPRRPVVPVGPQPLLEQSRRGRVVLHDEHARHGPSLVPPRRAGFIDRDTKDPRQGGEGRSPRSDHCPERVSSHIPHRRS